MHKHIYVCVYLEGDNSIFSGKYIKAFNANVLILRNHCTLDLYNIVGSNRIILQWENEI